MSKELYFYNKNINKIEKITSYIKINIATGNDNYNNQFKTNLINLFISSKIYPSEYVINKIDNGFYFEDKNLIELLIENGTSNINTPSEIITILNKYNTIFFNNINSITNNYEGFKKLEIDIINKLKDSISCDNELFSYYENLFLKLFTYISIITYDNLILNTKLYKQINSIKENINNNIYPSILNCIENIEMLINDYKENMEEINPSKYYSVVQQKTFYNEDYDKIYEFCIQEYNAILDFIDKLY